jgi:hypothetical protein
VADVHDRPRTPIRDINPNATTLERRARWVPMKAESEKFDPQIPAAIVEGH